ARLTSSINSRLRSAPQAAILSISSDQPSHTRRQKPKRSCGAPSGFRQPTTSGTKRRVWATLRGWLSGSDLSLGVDHGRRKWRQQMTTAHVNELGIVFRGFNPLDQPAAWWESLLDELKAHHVPGLHPHGKRMSVDVGASGGVR